MDSCFIDFEIVAMLFLSTLCVMAIILCMVLLSKSKEVTQEDLDEMYEEYHRKEEEQKQKQNLKK